MIVNKGREIAPFFCEEDTVVEIYIEHEYVCSDVIILSFCTRNFAIMHAVTRQFSEYIEV